MNVPDNWFVSLHPKKGHKNPKGPEGKQRNNQQISKESRNQTAPNNINKKKQGKATANLPSPVFVNLGECES